MKLATLTLLASAAMAAPAVTKPEPKVTPTAELAMREVDDITTDPFVAAYLQSEKLQPVAEAVQGSDLANEYRIVNGAAVTSDLPWFASINMITNMQPDGRASIGLCGGTLISSSHILTAAHCFYDIEGDGRGYLKPTMLRTGGGRGTMPNIMVQLGGNQQHFMIANGVVRRRTAADETEEIADNSFEHVASERAALPGSPLPPSSPLAFQQRAGVQIICHPEYDPRTQLNDICIVKLDANTTHPVVRLNLQTATRNASQVAANEAAGQPGIAFGYGDTSFQGPMSADLMETTMPLVGLAQCKKVWAYHSYGPAVQYRPDIVNSVLPNNVICADTTVSDTCQGDSGGPLLNERAGVQIGITSVGFDCASGIPSVYTKISAFQDWLLQVVGPLQP